MEIYTIGYGNRKWESFTELLIANKITLLVDIRSSPFSRFNPNFRKASLEDGLKNVGIKYLFLGSQLGGKPKDQSLYINDVLNYDMVKASHDYHTGILKLLESANSNVAVCVMCSELKPENCHRKNLVGKTLNEMGIIVKHIDEQGKLKAHHNDTGRLF